MASSPSPERASRRHSIGVKPREPAFALRGRRRAGARFIPLFEPAFATSHYCVRGVAPRIIAVMKSWAYFWLLLAAAFQAQAGGGPLGIDHRLAYDNSGI
jgi:hypothetical protein